LLTLFPTLLCVVGKANFTNLSRYSGLSDRTYRRHFSQFFDFGRFNQAAQTLASGENSEVIAVTDCTFVGKSGRLTYGLDWFYNGSASRPERGLEWSVIAVVDIAQNTGYTLSAEQTPPTNRTKVVTPSPSVSDSADSEAGAATDGVICASAVEPYPAALEAQPSKPKPRVTTAQVEAARAELSQLPDRSACPLETTRIDFYLAQLTKIRHLLPGALKYLVADGFYAKFKFVEGVMAQNLHLIGKLRVDADLQYLFTGPQNPRGAPRKYAGKVQFNDLNNLEHVGPLEDNAELYTAIVWHRSLKRQIRIALIVNTQKSGKTGYALLFSTDLGLDARKIVQYYRARFQIEFIFRDAKQFMGLCDAQTRDQKRLFSTSMRF
jgi:Transposase DDE domain